MPDHHPTLSPSSFPMLRQCSCYKAGKPSEAATSGQIQHEYLARLLAGGKVGPGIDLADDEKAQVEWAAEYIRLRTSDRRLVEERMILIDDDFEEITFGTLDVLDVVNRASGETLVVMDYKSGEDHGYLPQMAVYARMAMIRYAKATCEVHEIYGRTRYPKSYKLNLSETDFVLDIVKAVNDPHKKPRLNEFCKWCVKQGSCPETATTIMKVAAEYEADNLVAKLPLSEVTTWHASEITDPAQMAIVLRVAEFLGAWAESAKHGAREAAIKGMAIPGYVLKDGVGRREFVSVTEAYHASGLDADAFLACCKASVVDVSKAMAAKSGHRSEKIKAAKDDFDRIMGGVIYRALGQPTLKKVV